MAGDSVQDAVDTSVDTDVDTSTDDADDISWGDMVDQGSSNEDNSDDDDSDSKEDVAEETNDEEASESEEESDDEADSDNTADEEDKSDTGKPDPDKAREAFKERELRRQIQKEERERQEAKTLDRYLSEANDDEDELARRQLQVDSYNINKEKAALNQDKLESGIARAKADIALLSSTDPVIQEELGRALDEFQANSIEINEHGDIVSVKQDVYQYLKNKADSIERIRGIGAREESKKKATQKSRAMTPPSAKPKTKVDPDMAAFDEEMNRY